MGWPITAIVDNVVRFDLPFPGTPLQTAGSHYADIGRRWQFLDEEITLLDARLDELTAAIAATLRAMAAPSCHRCSPQLATTQTG